jgi:ribokinase
MCAFVGHTDARRTDDWDARRGDSTVTGRRLVVVGSANVDLVWRGAVLPRPGETVTDGEYVRGFGGKGANQACAAARLGAAVTFVGCVGDDDLGTAVRADLEATGVDCSWLMTAPGVPTGVALITVDAAGENAIAVAPGANRALTGDQVRAAIAATGDAAVLTSLEIGLVNAAAAISAAHGPVTFNPAPFDAAAAQWFDRCNTVVVNELEATAYGIDPDYPPPNVVVTLAARGARSATAQVDAFSVPIVDATGAGDAFCAAYAVTGDITAACAAGALACRELGARGSQATSADVAALVREQPRSPRR